MDWPQRKIKDALERAEEASVRDKGSALEDAVELIFNSTPGFRLFARDRKTAGENHEFDLVYQHDSSASSLKSFDDRLLIECKNWTNPVGAQEINWFASKIKSANSKVGVFVTASGVTGSDQRITAARLEIENARRSNTLILVVTLAELSALSSADDLIYVLDHKRFLLEVYGQNREILDPSERLQTQGTADPAPLSEVDRALDTGLIESPLLSQVRKPAHQMIIGARGSGKTALVRQARPTKIEEVGDDSVCLQVIVSAGSALRSIDLVDQSSNMSVAVQHALQRTVKDVFELMARDPAETLLALRRQWEGTSLSPSDGTAWPGEFSQLNFISELRTSIQYVNEALSMHGRAWALVVDDADLAPDLLDVLVDAMRSDENELFLKVTVAPSRGARSARRVLTSLPFLDYDVVSLDGEHARHISRSLVRSIVIPRASVRPGASERERILRSLQAKDPAFSEWLERLGPESNTRAARLRSAWRVLEWRDAMIGNDGLQRSRKTYSAYTDPAVLELIFGDNPRATSLFLNDARLSTSMSSVVQAQVLKCRALLVSAGAAEMMDAIGSYLRTRCFGAFTPDPPGSIYVDAAVPDSAARAIETLCNLGLLRFATSPYGAILGDIRGARMELAGIAYPMYGLPPRSGRAASLRKILDESATASRNRLPELELFRDVN